MNLTEKQLEAITANGHLLITGGPGSGKTTVSIYKAAQLAEKHLKNHQKILFLSFARPTVSRIIEVIEYEKNILPQYKHNINVETYHSFFWRLLKTHGYLIGLPRRLSILTPPEEAVALSMIRTKFPSKNLSDIQKKNKKSAEDTERLRQAKTEGKICFELFALYASQILQGSERIRHLIATVYPYIILDEFQDTNVQQWHAVKALGQSCCLITLADPEQRIYDWIGADPERLNQFKTSFLPKKVDLSANNHRSPDTEIATFGNDILTGIFSQKSYNGVVVDFFERFSSQPMTKLITTIYTARKRLTNQKVKNWSLAILVPTKRMTRLVSDALHQPPAKMHSVTHSAFIEIQSIILGSEIIAFLLQPSINEVHFEQFIVLLCNYFQGKGGDEPTQKALKEAKNIMKAYKNWIACITSGKTIHKKSIINSILSVYEQIRSLTLTGNPNKDWQTIQHILEKGTCKRLNEVAKEVKNIRILERGTQLRQALSQDWLDNGTYINALSIIRQAYMQEYFSTNAKPETGVVVMNMHKAKGKQFDEVIIFEGWPKLSKGKIFANSDRIVRNNECSKINEQTRQNFRVSITRAKRKVTILTPKEDPCVLFNLINFQ